VGLIDDGPPGAGRDEPGERGAPDGGGDVFDRIRAACAAVADRAAVVHIDLDALRRLAGSLVPDEPPLLPEERPVAERGGEGGEGDADAGDGAGEEAIAAQVVVWNAVNFGSGWFPVLSKREGLSGARTLAEALADHVAEHGVPTPEWLAAADAETCAAVFGQPHPGPVDDLLDLFAQAWRDLSALLTQRYGGSSAALVRSAAGSAAALVEVLGAMPLARDVSRYGTGGDAVDVPFYKRAQITVSHLGRAFEGRGLGRFVDADRLTAFADNLVPHVLRMAGVLTYTDDLAARIEAGEPLEPGSPEEVEIRACGVFAIELLARSTALTPASIDHQLWQRGQDPTIKAVPRHRSRCSWY
jgi:Potential Queuosine, Q, salvage protein family